MRKSFHSAVPKMDHHMYVDLEILEEDESFAKLEFLRGSVDDFRQQYPAAASRKDVEEMIGYLEAKAVAARNGDVGSVVETFEKRHPDLVYDGEANGGSALVDGILFHRVANPKLNRTDLAAKFQQVNGQFKHWLSVDDYFDLFQDALSVPASVQTIRDLSAHAATYFLDLNLFLTISFEIVRIGDYGVRTSEEFEKLMRTDDRYLGFSREEIKILHDYLSDGDKKKYHRKSRGTTLTRGLPYYEENYRLPQEEMQLYGVPVILQYAGNADVPLAVIPLEEFRTFWIHALLENRSCLTNVRKLKRFVGNEILTNAHALFEIIFYNIEEDRLSSTVIPPAVAAPAIPSRVVVHPNDEGLPPAVAQETQAEKPFQLPFRSQASTTPATPPSVESVTQGTGLQNGEYPPDPVMTPPSNKFRHSQMMSPLMQGTGLQSSVRNGEYPPDPVMTHNQNRFQRSTMMRPEDRRKLGNRCFSEQNEDSPSGNDYFETRKEMESLPKDSLRRTRKIDAGADRLGRMGQRKRDQKRSERLPSTNDIWQEVIVIHSTDSEEDD